MKCMTQRTHDREDFLCSLCVSEHSDLGDRQQWHQVLAQCSRLVPSVSTPPSQVPLHNRNEALQIELYNEDNGWSRMEVPLRLSCLCCLSKFHPKRRNCSNKQELEAIIHQKNYDIVAIMEMWWDDLHSWSAAMDGHKFSEGIGKEEQVVGSLVC